MDDLTLGALLGLLFGAGITWLCLHRNGTVDYLRGELAAAERDLRVATGSRRIGIRQTGPFPLAHLDTSGLCLSDQELAEWGVIATDRPRLTGMAA